MVRPRTAAEEEVRFQQLLADQTSPILCDRRTFLAALIVASKYLQDKNYSNKAWSKISGLPLQEINTNENAFLKLINWNLHVPFSVYTKWTVRLERLSEKAGHGLLEYPTPAAPKSRYGLPRFQSDYGPAEPSLEIVAGPPERCDERLGDPARSKHTPLDFGSCRSHSLSDVNTGLATLNALTADSTSRDIRGLPARRLSSTTSSLSGHPNTAISRRYEII